MNPWSFNIINQQRNELHTIQGCLAQTYRSLHQYEQEILTQYQGAESTQIKDALQSAMQEVAHLQSRCNWLHYEYNRILRNTP